MEKMDFRGGVGSETGQENAPYYRHTCIYVNMRGTYYSRSRELEINSYSGVNSGKYLGGGGSE